MKVVGFIEGKGGEETVMRGWMGSGGLQEGFMGLAEVATGQAVANWDLWWMTLGGRWIVSWG